MTKMKDLDENQQRMINDFGNGQDVEVFESPLQKSHRLLVEDKDKLSHYICILMNKMIQKKRDPSWDNFCGTPTWAVHSMNLTEAGRQRFGNRWTEIYKELMSDK